MILKQERALIRLLVALPKARSVRILARLADVPPSTATRFIKSIKVYGRLKFIPEDKFFGLSRIVIISAPAELDHYPPGTTYIRDFQTLNGPVRVIGALVPDPLVKKYLQSIEKYLDFDRIIVSRGYTTWIPNPEFMTFKSIFEYDIDLKKLIESGENEQFSLQSSLLRVPDALDMKILFGKLVWGPFIRPADILIKATKYTGDSIEDLPSKQVLSYHYRTHVLPGWRYTTLHIYRDMRKVPYIALYLAGREAPRLARILAYLPYVGYAIYGENSAFYMGQVPCRLYPVIAELVSTHVVEAPYGIMYMKPQLIAWVPFLWMFVRRVGERWTWQWPGQLRAEVRK